MKKYFYLVVSLFVIQVYSIGFCQDKNNSSNEQFIDREALIEKAREYGEIRVIVDFYMDYVQESKISTKAAQIQRASIKNLYEKFTNDFKNQGITIKRKGKIRPWMAVIVNEGTLKKMFESSLIRDILIDNLNEPFLNTEIISNIQADLNWEYFGVDGTGTATVILDTGVDSDHEFFSGRVVDGACFSSNESGAFQSTSYCPGGVEEAYGVESAEPCPYGDCYHGTHIAGIAAGGNQSFTGMAYAADIISVQVFSKFTSVAICSPQSPPCSRTWDSDVRSALEWVYDNRDNYNISSVNMSFGGGQYSSVCTDFYYNDAIADLASVNIIPVAASGNNGYDDYISKPACLEDVISVGGVKDDDSHMDMSNGAPILDLTAPGDDIYSSMPGDNYGNRSGTSFAAPFVTGVISLMKSVNPDLSVSDVRTILHNTADKVEDMDGQNFTNEFGYGRLNVYKAVKEALPYQYNNHTFMNSTTLGSTDIHNAIIWSGVTLTVPQDVIVVLEGDISSSSTNVFMNISGRVVITSDATVEKVHFVVENGGQLLIQPGAEIKMSTGATNNILVNPGGLLRAKGTEEDPIVFTRQSSGTAWNRISLNSSAGNLLEWCLIEGGYINLSIASKNNIISHTTIRDATYRTVQGWHNQDGTGNASAIISYDLIENSATVGLVGHYIDMDISYTTIRNNTQAGLYILSGTTNPFHHNIITGNGSSSRDGIEVMNSGTLWMQKSYYEDGYNEVYNNGEDQISNYGSLLIGTSPYPGLRNAVYGNYSGSRYLVENNTGSPVQAFRTYWGGSLSSAMFKGTVYTSNYLTSNPTSGVTHGYDGQAPSSMIKEIKPSITDTYKKAETELYQAVTRQQIRDGFNQLYQLAGISSDQTLSDRFSMMTQAAAEGEEDLYSSEELNTFFKYQGTLFYTKFLIRDERYEQVDTWLKKLDADALVGYDKQDYLHLKMVSETYFGDYQQAWQTLQDLYAFQQAEGKDMKEIHALYSPFEEDLLSRLDGKIVESVTKSTVTNDKLKLQAYPNPFNPVTNISFTLPDQSDVNLKVFDLMGREVAKLAAGNYDAGTHTVLFNASQLASGIYICRLQVGNRVFTQKVTLFK